MSGKTNRWYKCPISVYNTDVYLFLGKLSSCLKKQRMKQLEKLCGCSIKQIKKELESYLNEPDHTDNYCYDIKDDNKKCCTYIVGIEKFDSSNSVDIGVLAHETLHASMYILNDRGIFVDDNKHESLAYLHEYIFTYFFDSLKTNKKGNKQ